MGDGLIIVNTGPGKGKTTAALGLVVRALGNDLNAAFIQFIKSQDTGESRFLEEIAKHNPDRLLYARHGKGFVGKNPSQTDRDLAQDGLALARSVQGSVDLLVLDEINVALSLGLLDLAEVIEFVRAKPPDLILVLTGRGCPFELIELADTVTEMMEIKHAFRSGFPARKGVDF
jgi:cob(I)alamin adenosyltransferase